MADASSEHVPGSDDGSPANEMLVVGIGASAGGIAALKQFFAEVPARSGAAYAVILHLSPDYESRLSQVLQTATALPITQVNGRIPLEPDHVYVIAPNASLDIADGHIVAAPISGPEERRAPVDLFFRTLADAYGRNAVSIVLSGTGPNGSSGLKRVKEHGGLAIAQDPDEAEHGDMPRNSIATGLVDYVLPVAAIPAKVLDTMIACAGRNRHRRRRRSRAKRKGSARSSRSYACARGMTSPITSRRRSFDASNVD